MAIEREVSLKVSTKSDGGADLKTLVAQLEKLAASGGEAAPELTKLAAEIQRLEQARQAAQSLNALEQSFTEISGKVEATTASLATLRPQLDAAKATTKELATAQRDADLAFRATTAELAKNERQLAALNAQITAAGTATEKQATKQADLTAKISKGNAELLAKKSALDASNASLKSASDAEAVLASEVSKANREITSFNRQLDKQAASFEKSSQSAKALGVDTTNLAAEQQRLNKDVDGATQAAVDYTAALNRAAEQTKRLEQSKLDEAMRQQAIAAQRASEYTNWWSESLRKADAAAAAAAEEAKHAGSEMQNAFAALGVKSADQLENKLQELVRALELVRQKTGGIGPEWDRARLAFERSAGKIKDDLNNVDQNAQKASRSTGILTASFRQLAAVYSGIELGRKFLEANIQLENTVRALKAVTGSSKAAGEELQFVAGVADRLGVNINGLAQQYISLIASTNGTTLAGEKSRKVFEAVSNAMAQMGRTDVQVERAFMAISQMASKGVVSMEELRQQLGEALPGALQLAAKGLGVTTAELNDMVTSGQMLAEHFLPALTDALNEVYGTSAKVEGLQAAWGRFKNTLTQVSQAVGKGGVTEMMTRGLESVTAYVKILSNTMGPLYTIYKKVFDLFAQTGVFKALGVVFIGLHVVVRDVALAFELLGRTIAATLYSIVNFDLRKPIESFKAYGAMLAEIDNDIGARRTKSNQEIKQYIADVDKSGAASVAAGEAAQRAVGGIEANAAAVKKAREEAEANAKAQGKSADEIKRAGDAAEQSANRWTLVQNAYTKTTKFVEEATLVTEKLAAAKKFESDAVVRLAELTGNQTLALEASTKASTDYAASLQGVTSARDAELKVLQSQIAALRAEGEAKGGLSAAEQTAITQLQAKLPLKQAEVEKAQQAAEAARIEATERRIAAEVYKDNANKVAEYGNAAQAAETKVAQLSTMVSDNAQKVDVLKTAYEAATEALQPYKDEVTKTTAALALKQQQLTAGKATEEEVAAAQKAAQEATRRYNIEAAESVSLEKQLVDAKNEALPLEQQLSAARREGAQAQALYKDALKDAMEAAERKIKLMEQEQSLMDAKASVEMAELQTLEKKRVAEGREADAIEIKIRMKRLEIQTIEAGLAAKRKELDATIAVAQQELRDAEATGTLTAEKKFEIEARIRAAEAKKIELGIGAENVKQIELEIEALQKLVSVKRQENDADARSKRINGNPNDLQYEMAGGAANFNYEEMLYKMGATPEQVQEALSMADGAVKQKMLSNPINTTDPWGQINATKRNIELALAEVLNKIRYGTKDSDYAVGGGAGGSTATTPPGSVLKQNPLNKPVTTLQPVTINIGGTQQQLNVGSGKDVTTLETILRQLTEGAQRF